MDKRVVSLILTVAIAGFSILFFFQTKDPMILIFGIVAAGLVLGVLIVARLLRSGLFGGVRVRCRECSALNLEDAKFCSQCAQAI